MGVVAVAGEAVLWPVGQSPWLPRIPGLRVGRPRWEAGPVLGEPRRAPWARLLPPRSQLPVGSPEVWTLLRGQDTVTGAPHPVLRPGVR